MTTFQPPNFKTWNDWVFDDVTIKRNLLTTPQCLVQFQGTVIVNQTIPQSTLSYQNHIPGGTINSFYINDVPTTTILPSGSHNTSVGVLSGSATGAGTNITTFGNVTGQSITALNNSCSCFGQGSDVAAGSDHATAIGADAFASGGNRVVLGRTNLDDTFVGRDAFIGRNLTSNGAVTFNQAGTQLNVLLNRTPTNAFAALLGFQTAGVSDWQIFTASGGNSLNISQGAGGINQNLNLTLGTGLLSVISGTVSIPGSSGLVYTGAITASGAGPVALNTRVGRVTFTAQATILAGATAAMVINNTLATGASVGFAALQTNTAAAGSVPRIQSVVFGAGTITITIVNSSAATATGISDYTYWYEIAQ